MAEGWDCVGYDIEAHEYGDERYPGKLVLADVLTLNGADLAHVDLIVASPPCQAYSYMAMPWSKAKAKAAAIRADETGAALEQLNALFNACFRIQREASQAAGRYIPMVVENVRGAQPWVGRAAGNYGSFYFWGDVPALMPSVQGGGGRARQKSHPGEQWNVNRKNFTGTRGCDPSERGEDGRKNPGFRLDGSGRSFQTESVSRHVAEGRKGAGAGAEWFDQNLCQLSSKSSARKAASAKIAKIPVTLSRHIARVYRPTREEAA